MCQVDAGSARPRTKPSKFWDRERWRKTPSRPGQRGDTEYVSATCHSVDGKQGYRAPSDNVDRACVGENLANDFCWKYALGGHACGRNLGAPVA